MIVTGSSNAFLTITTLEVSEGGRQTVSAGFVSAAVSCGMLLGAVIASIVVQRMRGGVLVALAFTTLAIGFAGAALSPSTIAKAAFLVLSVLFLPAGNAVLGGFGNILVIVAVYTLSMRALVTLPMPDHWAEHIQKCHISRFE